MIISGTVAKGFEPVRDLYEDNMRNLAERNTQLCIYVGETQVVDLWASADNDPGFTADSLINVFSSGKSLESILLAMLVDRDLLSYEAPIATYWPEFGQRGKAEITVADLMRHEAGLAAFDTTIEAESLATNRLKANAVGRIIEAQEPSFRPGSHACREYHAVTRGWVANELFRRVEPDGRTMGEFLRAEVSEPLDLDVYIGLPESELPRLNPVALLGFGYQFLQGLVPRGFGRRVEMNLLQTTSRIARLRSGMQRSSRKNAPPTIAGLQDVRVFDSPAMTKGETPSAGAKCSARGLAKLAAVMAGGGQFGGHRIMGPQAFQALHDAPIQRNMLALDTTFSQGGLASFGAPNPADGALGVGLNVGREGFYGWMGLGGSIFQWHPELAIGFGYVPTQLHVLDMVNQRGKAYQAEVVRCVERQRAGAA